MKLNSFILFLFFSYYLVQNISAQISNGGFENWETIQNFERPISWSTNQDSVRVRLKKDTSSFEGNYSLKLVPSASSAWHQCESQAWIRINLSEPLGENKSLTFYAKTIPDSLNELETTFLRIYGRLYSSGDYIGPFEWETLDPIVEFSKIQIPILASNVDSISINISGGSGNGASDGCYGRSVSWIDGLNIEDSYISNIDTESLHKKVEVIIYPNPSEGIIKVQQQNIQLNKFKLYTLEGKLVKQGDLNEMTINIGNELKGLFILKLIDETSENYNEVNRRIIIE